MSKRETTTIPPSNAPYIDPNLPSQAASGVAAYAAGINARRGGALPKQEMPLNPPRPPIPTLSGAPDPSQRGGQTLADYGRAERLAASVDRGINQVMGPGSIIEEGAPAPAPAPAAAQRRVTPAMLGLAPADLLPQQAHEDPQFISGHGSEYAANQPQLAAKYGVIRNGKFIPPQKLGSNTGDPRISAQTIKDLETLQQLQQQQVNGVTPKEEAPADGLGRSAGKVGNMPGDDSVEPPSEEAKEKALTNAISQMDVFEFNQWRQLMMREILHSDEQRAIIEGRLKPMQVEDLILKGVVRQVVPIIPGKYEITLQSHDGQMELALKRLVMNESRSVDVGEQYYLDKHSFMSLAIGLYKINDKTFPDILNGDGVFDDKLFMEKFNQIMRLPIHMLASIGVNLYWFEMRVRKLVKADNVGNG